MVGTDAGCQHGGVPGSWELLTPVPLRLGADSTARKEREVMLRLKEVVDKQRDEIRAQAHEIVCKSRDTEAVSAGELEDVKGLGTCFPVPSPGPVSQACRGRCLSHAVQALVAPGGGRAVLLWLTWGCRGLSSSRSSCSASCP